MGVFMKLIVLVVALHYASPQQFQVNDSGISPPTLLYPSGDVRNCIFNMQTTGMATPRVLEALPGQGFDNLRNIDMDRVHAVNYKKCQMTSDGKYILPDGFFVVPYHGTDISLFSEYFKNWYDYHSLTSSSINVGGSLGFNRFSISGSHSEENRKVKTQQVRQNSATTRVQVRRVVYTVKLVSNVPVHPGFRERVYEIAANLAGGQVNLAYYCTELLIRDYGTHYLTSIDVGGVFAKNDFISRTYTESVGMTVQKLTSAASAGFAGFGGLDISFSRNSSQTERMGYSQNTTASDLMTVGGPPITENLSISNWQNGVIDNLAIVDRFGDPISFAITPTNFPEIDSALLRNVSNIIQETSDRYFDENNIPGCVDATDSNFNFQANNPSSESCGQSNSSRSYLERSLGGVYQSCTFIGGRERTLCDNVQQTNPLTGGYSCPRGYQAILLTTGIYSTTRTYSRNHRSCGGFLGWRCRRRTSYYTESTSVRYSTYWCAVTNDSQEDRGQLFGGFYSMMATNPFTSTRSCPSYYRPYRFGRSVQLCTSSDLELGGSRSVKFGGFFSCLVGNPLVSGPVAGSHLSWARACPRGYTQHLVTIDSNCEVSVCLEMGSFGSERLYQPKLPPYRTPQFNPNGSQPVIILGSLNTVLIKNIQGEWESFNSSDPSVMEMLGSLTSSSDDEDDDEATSSGDEATSSGVEATLSGDEATSSGDKATSNVQEEMGSSSPSGTAIAALVFGIFAIIAIIIVIIVITIIKARQ